MKRLIYYLWLGIFIISVMIYACIGSGLRNRKNMTAVAKKNEKIVTQALDSLKTRYAELDAARARKGIYQVAALWNENDGSKDDLVAFCTDNFINSEQEREILFHKLSAKFELILGHFHQIKAGLTPPLQEAENEVKKIDMDMGDYNVAAHFHNDMYNNKIAFNVILNFPTYTLAEKQLLSRNWSRLQWAYVRMGDLFTTRVPAHIQQGVSTANTMANTYISDYNIMMDALRNENGQQLFPNGMKLTSHWGLRDELKSNYTDTEHGFEKQHLIYTVMKRIVTQEIPEKVINNRTVTWKPISNEVYEQNKCISSPAEPNTRYKVLINNFKAMSAMDPHTLYLNAIERAFDRNMEFSKEEVKAMFITFISSPQVKQVAALIANRIGRPLKPFDIWYDGFNARSNIPEDVLTAKTQKLYPDTKTLERDLANLLRRLGFPNNEAQRISDKIQVDHAHGSGHAWGAVMKGEKARLRMRIPKSGMDYKAYNVAIHKFGHNVEQTISLYDVDHYIMNGVPNNAFTEALAFIFQKRDLELLGIKENNPNKQALKILDTFWGCYEIMGVALIDIGTWEWLYAHPEATPEQLKENILRIARGVWDRYYAPVLGDPGSPVLAIYSHIINNPLYLANYPMGHLIEFQLEEYLRGKHFATEILRIYKMGRLIPQEWMKQATGQEVLTESMLFAVEGAVEQVS